MSTRRTLDPPRYADAYSFRGLGRWRYAHERLRRPPLSSVDVLEADGPPREGAPVDPGEPRG